MTQFQLVGYHQRDSPPPVIGAAEHAHKGGGYAVNDNEVAQAAARARLQIEGLLAQLPLTGQSARIQQYDCASERSPPELLTEVNAQLPPLISTVNALVSHREAIQHELTILPQHQKLLRQLRHITTALIHFSRLATNIFQVDAESEPYFQQLVARLDRETNGQFYIAAQGRIRTTAKEPLEANDKPLEANDEPLEANDEPLEANDERQGVFIALYPRRYTATVQTALALDGIVEIRLPAYLTGKTFPAALTLIEQRRAELTATQAAIVVELITLSAQWRPRLTAWQNALLDNTTQNLSAPPEAPTARQNHLIYEFFIHLGKIIIASRHSRLTLATAIQITLPLILGLALGNVTYGILLFLANLQISKLANGQMGKWANGQMGKWANEQMGKWANAQMGKWANAQMNGFANLQIRPFAALQTCLFATSLWSIFFGIRLRIYSPIHLAWSQQQHTLTTLLLLTGVIGGGQVLLTQATERGREWLRRYLQWYLVIIIEIGFLAMLFGLAGFVARHLPAHSMTFYTAALVVNFVILLHTTEAVHSSENQGLTGRLVAYGHAAALGLSALFITSWVARVGGIRISALLGAIIASLTHALKTVANLSVPTSHRDATIHQTRVIHLLSPLTNLSL